MKKYGVLRAEIDKLALKINNEEVRNMFKNCFYSTLDTACEVLDDGTSYILTGDIPAMWLRDSSVQVMGYIPYADKCPDVKRLISGLIKRQMHCILKDPYSNAFNKEGNGNGHKDDTDFASPWIWERKYELDSLVYPLWLLEKYLRVTNDKTIFTDEVKAAINLIFDTIEVEQHHNKLSKYYFKRNVYEDIQMEIERPIKETGMVYSAFRPSDDPCTYGYLIPSNIFLISIFDKVLPFIKENIDELTYNRGLKIQNEVKVGLKEYGTYNHPVYGTIYAYEVDGLGHYNLMDDANVPSLLSLPYMEYCDCDDEIYLNTRKFILSKENPFYYEGSSLKGIGSPHTPKNYVWHIAVIMQLLTSNSKEERKECFKMLLNTHANKFVMHEGVDVNNPENFTREWFCWANTLFGFAVKHLIELGEIND